MKKILFLVALFITIPFKINAACGVSELANLKKIANNVNLSYEYVESNNPYFKVVINNITNDIYITDIGNDKYYYENTNNGELITGGYINSEEAEFSIYSNSGECKDKQLVTKKIKFPVYNQNFYEGVCIGATEYKMCQKWYKYMGTREEFIEEVNKYKESVNKEEQKQETIQTQKTYKILELYLKYYYIVLPAIIILSSLTIYFKNRNQSFKLK